MSEIWKLPCNIFSNDPPIENTVEPLKVNLKDIQIEACLEHPMARVDVKSEFLEEPGCSHRESNLDTNSSLRLKTEVPDDESHSSRLTNNCQIKCEPPDPSMKHEISSGDEGSCSSLADSNTSILSSSVKLESEDIGIKLENDLRHQEESLNIINSQNQKQQRNKRSQNKGRRPGLVNYICEVCNYQTRFKPHYRSHLITHKKPEDIDWYECPMCSHKTKTKANLYAHISTHKPADEIHHCTECNYKTKYRKTYKRHLLGHGIVKIDGFKCPYCHYETPNKYTLEMHVVIHKDETEANIFFCPLCPYKGKRKRDLRVHSLKHKSSDEVTMFQCTLCEYRTKRKADLKSHSIRHKHPDEVEVLHCPFCSYQTKYKNAFKTHMMRHKNPDEVELFDCDHCDYKTRFKHYLKKHRLFKHKVQDHPLNSSSSLV